MKIGFIGLGIMGKPMSKNLLKAGYDLVAYARKPEVLEELAACGAGIATTIEELVGQCELIITMLPNGPDVENVVCGENGVLCYAKPGLTIIDMSSIAPLTSKCIAEKCAECGVSMLDAPVSGGEPKAIDATLSIMCGGPKEIFIRFEPVLKAMGSSVIHCGETNGAGNTVKLANQIIVAVNIAACSEAFSLAARAGVKPNVVYEAIRGGLAGSTVMDAKLPMMLDGDFKPGFKIDLHIKDLSNVLDTGMKTNTPLPLTSEVMQMLQVLKADGCGGEDHSAIVKYYEKLTGTQISS